MNIRCGISGREREREREKERPKLCNRAHLCATVHIASSSRGPAATGKCIVSNATQSDLEFISRYLFTPASIGKSYFVGR
mmetsp:Transcript_7878/g.11177  ORF Transcript_7878/g.11177 Transcript_7878/m.11177 type:complete len:80 (-) Transcript_7878:313-552(-)